MEEELKNLIEEKKAKRAAIMSKSEIGSPLSKP